jgi:RNA polymerase sigma-70 factor, ECF subfamily
VGLSGTSGGLTRAELAELYRRYGTFLRRRARLVTRDPALADDALHEACLNLLRSGADYRGARQPLSWLYRVVDRASIDQLRRGKRLRSAAVFDDLDELASPPGVDHDLRLRVLELLGGLDPESAEVAVMAFVDGMTQGEIAEELGYSRVTINKRVQAIRQQALCALDGPAAPLSPGDRP